MFCPLAQVEIRVDTCPVKCMYRSYIGECHFNKLTDEEVDATVIACSVNKKVYKIKSQIQSSKNMIEIGLTIDQYADYIRESVPKAEEVVNTKQVSNSGNVHTRLKEFFLLSDNQQEAFWDEERFLKWSKRHGVSTTLQNMRHALVSV